MGRTKGSKNGISTTPGYIAIGEKAKGQLLNAGNKLASNFTPAVNTLKKKLKTKDLNPAMPSSTAKYLDKQKEAKEKAMEPKVNPQQNQMQTQKPVSQEDIQQSKEYSDKMGLLKEGLKKLADTQQSQEYDKKIQDAKPAMKKIVGKEAETEPNQNGNTDNKGGKGKSLLKQLKSFASGVASSKEVQSLAKSIERGAVRGVGTGEVKKMAKSGLQDALNKIPDKAEKREASDKNNLKDFVKADIKDRANDIKSKAIKKGKKYATNTLDRMLEDERIQGDLKDLAETGYFKGEKEAAKQVLTKMTDPKQAKKFTSVALDAAMPTYKGSKAKNEDRMRDFIENDLEDRINEAKKKAKDKAANKVQQSVASLNKDKRMTNEMRMLKEDPEAAIKKMVNDAKNDPKTAQKYKEVAADLVMPTYEGSKAENDDNFFDFMMNDIQDRRNEYTKKFKKKVTSR